ncbi:rRNA methyltransferase 3, mitochondrial-like [Diadema antillarum]|uniref:rRNA methyltransferase 3, mitochondrial-like n=1 Tax=Diadema antillarum TaxID=105358 RepID=UPI003A860121
MAAHGLFTTWWCKLYPRTRLLFKISNGTRMKTSQLHTNPPSFSRIKRGITPRKTRTPRFRETENTSPSSFTPSAASAGCEIDATPRVYRQKSRSDPYHVNPAADSNCLPTAERTYSRASPKRDNVPSYEKARPDDKRLGRAVMLAKSRKFREQKKKVILEGKRLISDALAAGAKAETIFFSQVSAIEGLPLSGSKVNLLKVSYKDIALWSELGTPQGIIGIFHQPNYDHLCLDGQHEEKLPLVLICDNVRDPGNLGTIIRSAAAAACIKVLLTKGCVDVWEPKVLRSGAGAHFRIPIISSIPWSSLPNYLTPDTRVHIANCYRQHDSNTADSNGPSNQTYTGHWRKDEPPCSHGNNHDRWPQSSDGDLGPGLRIAPYFDVNWAVGSSALVIGGEAQGLSLEARELCEKSGGKMVYVPMSLGVDSLNAAMASSVMLFEAKRQLVTSIL